jgi:hypothetical protein
MHVILGTDADSQANPYLRGLAEGLAVQWRQQGHRVTDTGSLPDASQSERTLQDPNATILLVSDGPVARRLASVCRGQGRPYLSTSIAVEGHADASASFSAALTGIHSGAERVITPVPAAWQLMQANGVRQPVLVSGGVDDEAFQPRVYDNLDLPRPISMLLSTGLDNNALRLFLETPLPGSKVAYVPNWTGPVEHDGVSIFSYMGTAEQASLISSADVCIVADRGIASLVLAARSLACGVPVASLPGPYVTPLLDSEEVGATDENLGRAVTRALSANRQLCRRVGSAYGWRSSARQILGLLGDRQAAIAA